MIKEQDLTKIKPTFEQEVAYQQIGMNGTMIHSAYSDIAMQGFLNLLRNVGFDYVLEQRLGHVFAVTSREEHFLSRLKLYDLARVYTRVLEVNKTNCRIASLIVDREGQPVFSSDSNHAYLESDKVARLPEGPKLRLESLLEAKL